MTLKIQGVEKSYSRRPVLRDISLTLERGGITGLLGANGAGKSTLLKILAGYFHPSRGQVTLGAVSLNDNPREYRRLTGYLPEGAPLPAAETPDSLLASQYRLYKGSDAPREVREKIAERYGLGAGERHSNIKTLSRGYRQRTGLALATVMEPALLLLDEPFAGLDPSVVRRQRRILREDRGGRITLFSSHILQEVYALCDSLIILHKGRVRAIVRTSEYDRWEDLDDFYGALIEEGGDDE